MIRLQLDILPGGNIASKDPIAEVNVALVQMNDKTQDAKYKVIMYYQNNTYRVINLEHNRRDGIWVLMEKVFGAIEKKLLSERLKNDNS